MTVDIARDRLRNQALSRTGFTEPGEAVAWFGAVQAQDYGGAKWGLGLRLQDSTEAAIEQAFAGGRSCALMLCAPRGIL